MIICIILKINQTIIKIIKKEHSPNKEKEFNQHEGKYNVKELTNKLEK